MTTPGEQLAAILREPREQPDVITATVAAILVGDVIDNIAIASATIAALRAAHEAEYGGDG